MEVFLVGRVVVPSTPPSIVAVLLLLVVGSMPRIVRVRVVRLVVIVSVCSMLVRVVLGPTFALVGVGCLVLLVLVRALLASSNLVRRGALIILLYSVVGSFHLVTRSTFLVMVVIGVLAG
jgi:hypothetical protein